MVILLLHDVLLFWKPAKEKLPARSARDVLLVVVIVHVVVVVVVK